MKKILLSFALICIFGVNVEAKSMKECPKSLTTVGSAKHFYAGGGVSARFSYLSLKMKEANEERKTKGSKLAGTAVVGGGTLVSNSKVYVGGEVLVDATKNYCALLDIPGANAYKIRENGFIPSVYVRAGYACDNKLLPYIKAGATFENNKVILGDTKKKVNKVLFDVALGLESPSYNSFSARIEGGYAFNGGKNVNIDGIDLKLKNKGSFSLRAMSVFHI